MTSFLILGALMVLAALAVLLWPLLRRSSSSRRWPAVLLILLVIPVCAGLYPTLSNWDWRYGAMPQTPEEIERMLASLEARLARDPQNVDGWLLLGRSYFQLNRFYKSADAYQRAYTLTQGGNVEALLGLGEALTFSDETMLTGRAAGLFERALQLRPDHPKALWYTGLVAYQSNQPALAREHWSRLVELDPPDDVKKILNAKIAELDRRLQTAGEPAPIVRPAASERQSAHVNVRIALAPGLTNKLPSPATLFVLARTGGGGPPLAVKKLSVAGFPLTVQLTDRDAMIAGRNLSSADEVTIVARISRSGAPQAQSGDLEGKLNHAIGDPRLAHLIVDSVIP